MESRKPRAPREPLIADAEVYDQQSNQTIPGRTSDVSIGGCFVETPEVLPLRTVIRLKLFFNEETLTLFGDVVRADPEKGMGIRFRTLDANQISVLKGWFFSLDRPGW
jgi:hypothetical protein